MVPAVPVGVLNSPAACGEHSPGSSPKPRAQTRLRVHADGTLGARAGQLCNLEMRRRDVSGSTALSSCKENRGCIWKGVGSSVELIKCPRSQDARFARHPELQQEPAKGPCPVSQPSSTTDGSGTVSDVGLPCRF